MNSNAQPRPPIPAFMGDRPTPVIGDMTDEIRRTFEADRAQLRPVDPSEADPLAAIARLIAEPPVIPKVGQLASQGMREAFEKVAEEIVAVAQDGVARANRNLQDAMGYAEVIRQSGDQLCGKIETDAVRLLQYSRVMREARAAFGGPPPAEGG